MNDLWHNSTTSSVYTIQTRAHRETNVHPYTHAYARTHKHTHTHTHTHIHTYKHTHTHVSTHIRTHTHTHTRYIFITTIKSRRNQVIFFIYVFQLELIHQIITENVVIDTMHIKYLCEAEPVKVRNNSSLRSGCWYT